MKPIGIIVNPASGKDIRRLIAKGTTVTNQDKINAVIRMILAMDALGVTDVQIMPDTTGMGRRIIKELEGELTHCRVTLLKIPYILGTQKDTTRAAELMDRAAFACMIVMGGDGTCRVAAKGAGNTPIIPVSTGTNNVFPQVVEGTLVGMAAGYLAIGKVATDDCCQHKPLLHLKKAGKIIDIALVDLVTVDAADTAARAVWESEQILELFLTTAAPDSIGLSSIGGWVAPLQSDQQEGLHITLGESGRRVVAPIAPGLLKSVTVKSHHHFDAQKEIALTTTPCVVALDGEREVIAREGESWSVEYLPKGPLVVNIASTLQLACQPKAELTEVAGATLCPLTQVS